MCVEVGSLGVYMMMRVEALSMCLVLAACASEAEPRDADAGYAPDGLVSRAATVGNEGSDMSGCQRDVQCDGVGATCHPTEHVCLMRCPTVEIDSAAALVAARRCREIDGDLILRDPALQRIGTDYLPYLERISGMLLSAGSKRLQELTLTGLRVVGGDKRLGGVQITLDAEKLEIVSLPRLFAVHGSVVMFGLSGLREIHLGALTRIDDTLALTSLPRLTALLLDPGLSVGTWQLENLCNLPAESVEGLTGASPKAVGCCTDQGVQCEQRVPCKCP